jgi:hypothetical protein
MPAVITEIQEWQKVGFEADLVRNNETTDPGAFLLTLAVPLTTLSTARAENARKPGIELACRLPLPKGSDPLVLA